MIRPLFARFSIFYICLRCNAKHFFLKLHYLSVIWKKICPIFRVVHLLTLTAYLHILCTGSSDSKRDNVSSIYRVFELKMRKTKVICMFIGNGHLTIDPWIWLKVTFLSSTASVLKDGRILLEILSFSSKKLLFETSK